MLYPSSYALQTILLPSLKTLSCFSLHVYKLAPDGVKILTFIHFFHYLFIQFYWLLPFEDLQNQLFPSFRQKNHHIASNIKLIFLFVANPFQSARKTVLSTNTRVLNSYFLLLTLICILTLPVLAFISLRFCFCVDKPKLNYWYKSLCVAYITISTFWHLPLGNYGNTFCCLIFFKQYDVYQRWIVGFMHYYFHVSKIFHCNE